MRNSMNYLVLTLLFTISISGCTLIKSYSLIKSGSVEQREFTQTIPFNFEHGIILIEAWINDVKCNMILDSGAPCAVSKQVQSTANLQTEFSAEMEDSQQSSQEVDFTKINRIKIGDLQFNQIGGLIIDLDQGIRQISCLEADGIIGSNLMRLAIWEIDYKNQKITISNSLSNFEIDDQTVGFPFSSSLAGSPKIDMNVSGVRQKKVLIDLGMRGGIEISSSTFEKLLEQNKVTRQLEGHGNYSAGMFGYGEPQTDKFAIVDKINIGSKRFVNQLITFVEEESTQKIGNQFLQNFKVILDWEHETVYFIREKDEFNSDLSHFGFKAIYRKTGKVEVGYIFKKSKADSLGLKLSDQIIQINDINCRNISLQEWCSVEKLFSNGFDSIFMITSRNGIEKEVRITKKVMFDHRSMNR